VVIQNVCTLRGGWRRFESSGVLEFKAISGRARMKRMKIDVETPERCH
jgi:hypothetical protein